MKSRSVPIWNKPQNLTKLPKLKLYNSLTNRKDLFIPKSGNKVDWYSCGPTVYDVSHMGHARTYISIDILRRVMSDYFKYDIHFVMNITDVDDKIIKRARQNYLFDQYLNNKKSEYIADVKEALENQKQLLAKEHDEDKIIMYKNEIEKINEILKLPDVTKEHVMELQGAISDMLDNKLGSTITDNKIFEALPKHYEQEFHEDMKKLNILPPDTLTHVSTYIYNIIDCCTKIINNGYAYESNGSVYFDTVKFDSSEKFYYAKLVPNAFGNENLLKEGEGVLSNVEDGEKRSSTDFALWKASKPGEPSWPSPWGLGRPGWHIECSAMATDTCGGTLDIHTGGVDLKFPHHDNELAQAEAMLDSSQWCNYFLHTGHLTISGCKMSKSLKNFVSIRDALKKHSWRQLRLAFLTMSWKDTLDYSDETMQAACSLERQFLDFFFTVEHVLRVSSTENNEVNASEKKMTKEIEDLLEKTKARVEDALCDSIDTKEAISALRDLMTVATASYMNLGASKCDIIGLHESALLIYKLLKIFGAAESHQEFGLIHYTAEELRKTNQCIIDVGKEYCKALMTILSEESTYAQEKVQLAQSMIEKYQKDNNGTNYNETMVKIAEFRQSIRLLAISEKWKRILMECDNLRDVNLPKIGIRLQDTTDKLPAVGLYPSWAFIETGGCEKKKVTNIKSDEKVNRKVEKSMDPSKMFIEGAPYIGKYKEWDENGFPILDIDGNELSNSQKKKLKKEFQLQKEAYEKYQSNLKN